MRAKTLALVALTGIGILAWMPAAAADDPPAAQIVEEFVVQPPEDACLNYTPVEGTEVQLQVVPEVENDAATPNAKPPKGCRACQEQPWCACTYNGHPRISCDPCCYSTWSGPICTS